MPGYLRCRITASASTRTMPSASLASFNAYTPVKNILARELAWQFAGKLSNTMAGASGRRADQERGRRSTLRSPCREVSTINNHIENTLPMQIWLVEDNQANAQHAPGLSTNLHSLLCTGPS